MERDFADLLGGWRDTWGLVPDSADALGDTGQRTVGTRGAGWVSAVPGKTGLAGARPKAAPGPNGSRFFPFSRQAAGLAWISTS